MKSVQLGRQGGAPGHQISVCWLRLLCTCAGHLMATTRSVSIYLHYKLIKTYAVVSSWLCWLRDVIQAILLSNALFSSPPSSWGSTGREVWETCLHLGPSKKKLLLKSEGKGCQTCEEQRETHARAFWSQALLPKCCRHATALSVHMYDWDLDMLCIPFLCKM